MREAKDTICLVTGGTSGVGKATATGIARAGATVVLVARDAERGRQAAQRIREATGNRNVDVLTADLSRMQSIRELAAAFTGKYGALHVLSNNAAALVLDRRLTPDGNELIFATNYLGHFLLTNLLLDTLRKSAPSRIITVAGTPGTIQGVQIDPENPMPERGFSALHATLQAAAAKVLFTLELARRLQDSGVTANTFHPGIVRSGLPRHLPWLLRVPASLLMSLLQTECDTSVFLALSSEVEGMSGAFFVGRKAAPFQPPYDPVQVGGRLWKTSERLAGIAV